MKRNKTIRLSCLFFSVLFLFFSLPLSAFAISNIDSTDVCSDLQSMGVDLSLYQPSKELYSPKIMVFYEYAFDENGNQFDYGLYLYVYNPSREEIDIGSKYNTVQIVTKSITGNVTSNKKYPLLFVSKSTKKDGSNLDGLYYKFKVNLGNSFLGNLSKEQRTYNIVDLELQYKGEVNPRTSNVSATYVCTGFQPYHHSDPKTGKLIETSTYKCDVVELETIDIKLHPATWKTTSSDKGSHYQYEVSSVYFSIPDYFLEKYGNMADENFKGLDVVHGEWYEYKTNGIVSNNEQFVELANTYLGVTVSDGSMTQKRLVGPFGEDNVILGSCFGGSAFYRCYYSNAVPFGFLAGDESRTSSTTISYFNRLYAIGLVGQNDAQLVNPQNKTFGHKVTHIPSILNAFYSDLSSAPLLVSTQDLLDSICGSGEFYYLPNVDDGRRLGHNEYHISVDDASLNSKIAAYATKNTKIGNWLAGKGWIDSSADAKGYEDMRPIVMLDSDDVDGSFSEISSDLFVCEQDVGDLKNFVDSQNGRTTYLMRFAVTDYFCSEIDVTANGGGEYSGKHYYFEKTFFHNFDVLSFTFKNERGEYTTVPVSSRPITIVGNVTMHPTDVDTGTNIITKLSWWFKLLILAVGVVVIILVVTWLYSKLNKARNAHLDTKLKRIELKEQIANKKTDIKKRRRRLKERRRR